MQTEDRTMVSRILFRNSPGEGFLFGSGLLLWWMFFLLLLMYPLPATLNGEIPAIACAASGGILFVGSWAYGSILLGQALFSLAEEWPLVRRFRYGVWLFALVFPLAGLALAPFLFRRRRWISALCALTGVCAEVIPMVYSFSPQMDGILFFGGQILLFLSAFGIREGGGRRRWIVFFPIGCWVLLLLGIPVCEKILEGKITGEKNTLSRLLGQSVELPEFRKREQTGISIQAEPLKSLIASVPDSVKPVKYRPGRREMMRCLAELEKTPAFLAAREALLKLPPQNIVHDWPGRDMLFNMQLSEMEAFRIAALYSGFTLQLNASDRAVVFRSNAELERLRDWMLCGNTLFAGLLADRMEVLRLNSLSPVLASGAFSREEMLQLAGAAPPNFGRVFARAMGWETTVWDECFRSRDSLSDRLKMVEAFSKHFGIRGSLPPLPSMIFFLRVHFLRDHLYLLRQFRMQAELFLFPEKMPLPERMQTARVDKDTIRKKYFNWTKLTLAENLFLVHFIRTEVEAYHQMVRIAVEILEYRRTHGGKLPASLAFLPPSLPRLIDGIPIGYQAGFLSREKGESGYGFRLFLSCEIPDRNPPMFEVILSGNPADGTPDA